MTGNKWIGIFLFSFFTLIVVHAETKQLTNGANLDLGSRYNSDSPQFSPDGKKICFSSSRGAPWRNIENGINIGTWHIFIMDLEGKNVSEITHMPWDVRPAWSPKGDVIAFDSYGDNRSGRLSSWMVNLVDHKPWQFKEDAHVAPGCWSPDGENIVFSHGNQLWISPSDNSSKAKPLTKIPPKPPGPIESYPAWSPDGLWIAYLTNDDSILARPHVVDNDSEIDDHDEDVVVYSKIWLIRPNGADQKLLFSGGSRTWIKWARDGKSLYFNDQNSIVKFDIKERTQKVLFTVKNLGTGCDISPDEKWFVYDNALDNNESDIFIRPFSVDE